MSNVLGGAILAFIGFGFYFGFAVTILQGFCNWLNFVPALSSGCSSGVNSIQISVPNVIFIVIGLMGIYLLIKK